MRRRWRSCRTPLLLLTTLTGVEWTDNDAGDIDNGELSTLVWTKEDVRARVCSRRKSVFNNAFENRKKNYKNF